MPVKQAQSRHQHVRPRPLSSFAPALPPAAALARPLCPENRTVHIGQDAVTDPPRRCRKGRVSGEELVDCLLGVGGDQHIGEAVALAQRLDRPQVLAYTCDAAIDSTTLYAYPASPSGTRLHIRPCDTSVTI